MPNTNQPRAIIRVDGETCAYNCSDAEGGYKNSEWLECSASSSGLPLGGDCMGAICQGDMYSVLPKLPELSFMQHDPSNVPSQPTLPPLLHAPRALTAQEVWEGTVHPLKHPNEINGKFLTCFSCFMFNDRLRDPDVVALFGGARCFPFTNVKDLTVLEFDTLRDLIRDPIVNGTYAYAPHVHGVNGNKCPLFPTKQYQTGTLGGVNATKLHNIFKNACKARNTTLLREQANASIDTAAAAPY